MNVTRSIQISLPWPPSVNTYWRHPTKGPLVGRSLISEKGRAYRVAVAEVVYAECVKRHVLTGRLAVMARAYPPDLRQRDLDNLWKGLLDALTHVAVIRDDGDIDDLHIVRGPVRKGGAIEITIAEIPGEPMKSGALFAEASAA